MKATTKEITLSVCMIVKNEENHLGRCLESIKDVADEIVVVDTGSTDRTVEIAKSYGVKLIEEPWEDDFSKARNTSLRAATMEWILFLDADETLPHEDGLKLKRVLGNKKMKFEGYYLRLGTIIDEECTREAVVLRVFKNNKDYYFTGRIHEQIIATLQAKKGMNCTGEIDVMIRHYGYDQDEAIIEQKHLRNINLLLKATDEEKNCYHYYVLGNEYLRADDVDKAIECFELSYNDVDYVKYPYMHYPYLIMNLLRMYIKKEDYQKGVDLIAKVKPSLVKFRDLYFMEFLIHFECQRYSKAAIAYQIYKNQQTKGKYEYPCNHFENYYNMNVIESRLQAQSIKHQAGILDTVVMGSRLINETLETVKSISEISERILVVGEAEDEEITRIKGYGCEWMVDADEAADEWLGKGVEISKAKYILLLDAGKICSYKECTEILGLVVEEDGPIYTLCDENPRGGEPVRFGRLVKHVEGVDLGELLEE